MAQNLHVSVSGQRRPINQKNVKKRLTETAAVLNFLKERKAAK
jgi:hypothetical protein